MKRLHHKPHGAVLLCCAAALLVPWSAHGQASADKRSMMDPVSETIQQAGDIMSDIRLHTMLEAKLARNEHLSALSIDTDVDNGKAYLTGEVATGAQRQLAGELAASIEGITEVQNDLVVRSAEPGIGERLSQQASDAAVTAKVKSRLLVSDNTSGLAIDVSTANDIVTLEGEVGSDTERELAGLIAGNTAGVAEVNNKLKVKPE